MILEQVVSRHDAAFDIAGAQLGLGRDGQVYLTSGGRVLRVGADGASRLGQVGYSAATATADAHGTIATAEGHFPHRVAFWDQDFTLLGHIDDFTVNDTVGYYSPNAVESPNPATSTRSTTTKSACYG